MKSATCICFRLTLTSFAVEATKGNGESRQLLHSRLTLTSFAVEATPRSARRNTIKSPPHAHFVRGGGDLAPTLALRLTADRLTLTSFAVEATLDNDYG